MSLDRPLAPGTIHIIHPRLLVLRLFRAAVASTCLVPSLSPSPSVVGLYVGIRMEIWKGGSEAAACITIHRRGIWRCASPHGCLHGEGQQLSSKDNGFVL